MSRYPVRYLAFAAVLALAACAAPPPPPPPPQQPVMAPETAAPPPMMVPPSPPQRVVVRKRTRVRHTRHGTVVHQTVRVHGRHGTVRVRRTLHMHQHPPVAPPAAPKD
jgi:hypothetical protein